MRKRILLGLLTAALAVALTGCGLRAPEELYALPDPSPEYKSLQSSLESLLNMGYEYAAPISGSHTQSVQLEDLDGDGVDEALAFLRDTSGKEHPLKICIFKADGEGGYTQYCTIAGDGDMINSVVYCQLNGTPTKELVVGWRIFSTVYVLSAYSIENGNVTELMTASNYTRYAVKDMDQDNQEEIVSILMNSSDDAGGSTATYYDWSEDTMKGINSVSLSANADSLDSVRYHYLTNSYPALYVTSFLRNNGSAAQSTSSVVTDVLGVVNKRLSNLTLDPQSGDSTTVHLALAEPRDINSDNVLELPMSLPLRSNGNVEHSEGAYVLNWVQYALDGAERSVNYTYHNTSDGWYLILPDDWFTGWDGTCMNGLLVSRSDTNVGATVERSITFYHQGSPGEQPEPFLTIQKNTGSNRDSRATIGERFLLTQTADATYSAEFVDSGWSCGLSRRELVERFKLILNDWSVN